MKGFTTFLFFLLLSIASLFSPQTTLAEIFFQDDFNDGDANGWIVKGTLGWQVVNGEYGIYLNPGLSDSIPSDEVWNSNWNNYIYEVDLRGVYGVDKNVILRYKGTEDFYEIHHTGGEIYFDRHRPIGGYHVCNPVSVYLSNNRTYHIKAEVNGNHFKIYIDNNLIFNVYDNLDPLLEGRIGLRVGTGSVSPSEVWYDNVLVTDLSGIPTPTPTLSPTPTPSPTSTPTPHPKIILLPGLGASWNVEKLVFGNEVPQSAWKLPSWVPHYNNLISALENIGYQKNKDLFIFTYDWTKPINFIANDLKNYIQNIVNPPPGEKINLVGHSLGGLVGRTYIQKNSPNHHVKTLITLGSPHQGAPQAYKAWGGADLQDLIGLPWRIPAEIVLMTKLGSYQNKVEALRNTVPVVRDLLPIFDYLKWDKNNQIISEATLPQESRNLWLTNLGITQELLDLTTTIVGTINSACRWLKVVPRDKVDEILGRWKNGKPVSQEYDIGDQTVLASSAKLNGANIISLPLDHSDLVRDQEGIEKILETLGLEIDSLALNQNDNEGTQFLVFLLTSKDNLKIVAPDGTILLPQEDNIVVISNPLVGEYKAEITGGYEERYKLFVGYLNSQKDIWFEYEDLPTLGEIKTYTIPFDPTFKTTSEFLLKLINEKLKLLENEINSLPTNFFTKAKIKAGLAKIYAELKPVPILLSLKNKKEANKFIQKAIEETSELTKFVEKNKINEFLSSLRNFQNLLNQLHDLLNL